MLAQQPRRGSSVVFVYRSTLAARVLLFPKGGETWREIVLRFVSTNLMRRRGPSVTRLVVNTVMSQTRSRCGGRDMIMRPFYSSSLVEDFGI